MKTIQFPLAQSQYIAPQYLKKSRIQYSGGYKIIKQKKDSTVHHPSKKTLEKNQIYQKMGLHFQPEPQQKSNFSNMQFLITNTQKCDCKFKQKYKCQKVDNLIKTIKIEKQKPLVPRAKQIDTQNEVIYYYQPNIINKNQKVIMGIANQHQQNILKRQQPKKQITKNQNVNNPNLIQDQVKDNNIKNEKKQVVKIRQKKEPTINELYQYKQKYKNYNFVKRDHFFIQQFIKIIQKIDFERYQCTSPNIQRVKAIWTGKFSTVIKNFQLKQKQYPDGFIQLKQFIFWYLCNNKIDLTNDYEKLAQQFLVQFQKFHRSNKNQKKNLQSYQKFKLDKNDLYDFLFKVRFISLLLELELSLIQKQKVQKLNYNQYLQLLQNCIIKHQQKQQQKIIVRESKVESEDEKKYTKKFKAQQQLNNLNIKNIPISPVDLEKKKISTIRQQNLKLDLKQKQQQELKLINYKFKARQIPKSVSNTQLYQKLLISQKQKHQQSLQKHKQKAIQNDRTFNVYHKQKKIITPDQYYKWNKQFKARSVPQNILKPMLEEMKKQKDLSKSKLKARQQQLLQNSKYPATMEYLNNIHEYKNNIINKVKSNITHTYNFHPEKHHEIPKFEELHQKYNVQLEQKKLSNTTTLPKQFNFSEMNKRQIKFTVNPNENIIKTPIVKTDIPKIKETTQKYQDLVSSRQKSRQKKVQNKKMGQNKGKYIQELSERLIKNIPPKKEPEKKPQLKNEWKKKKQELIEKVYKQSPLIIQRNYERKNGKKTQYILQPVNPTDQYQTIL